MKEEKRAINNDIKALSFLSLGPLFSLNFRDFISFALEQSFTAYV
jgi:hypothetical protein